MAVGDGGANPPQGSWITESFKSEFSQVKKKKQLKFELFLAAQVG